VKKITNASEIAGGRVVTSFPFLTKRFFEQIDNTKNVATKITEVSGSVEVACGLGLADAVVDLVETGRTMRAAGLEAIAETKVWKSREDQTGANRPQLLREVCEHL